MGLRANAYSSVGASDYFLCGTTWFFSNERNFSFVPDSLLCPTDASSVLLVSSTSTRTSLSKAGELAPGNLSIEFQVHFVSFLVSSRLV